MRTALPLVILAALAFVGAILFWPDAPQSPDEPQGVAPGAGQAALAAEAEALASDGAAAALDASGSSAGERRAAPLVPVVESGAVDPGSSAPRWTGRVINDLGVGVADAEVILTLPQAEDVLGLGINVGTGGGGTRAVTDADGRFSLPARDAGRYRLQVGADGFAPLDLATLDTQAGDQDLGSFQLEPGLLLSGRVVDEGGAPVVGAMVTADALRATGWSTFTFGSPEELASAERTDSDGRFQLTRLELGSKRLNVQHPEHPRRTFNIELRGTERERNGLELVVPRGGSIAGQVAGYEAAERSAYRVVAAPLAGPQLTQGGFAGPAEAEVAPDGAFEFRGLEPAGTYELTVMRLSDDGPQIPAGFSGFALAGDRREVSDRQKVEVGNLGVLLSIRAGAVLSFQLLDNVTGEPIERFRARLGRGGLGANLDVPRDGFAEGQARFEDVYPEADPLGFMPPETLTLSAEGYQDLDVSEVALELGRTTDLGVLRMEPADQLRVRVTDLATGEPLRGASVQVGPAGPSFADAELGGGGEEGDAPTMSFTMTRTVSLDEVDDAEGPPEFESLSGPSDVKVARTDKEGWAYVGLPAGDDLQLTVVKRGFAEERRALADLVEGEPVEIALGAGGQVTIRVVDEAGEPVADARVEHRAPRRSGGAGRELIMGGPGRQTNAKGEVVFEDLIPGEHRFRLVGGGSPMFNFGDGSAMMISGPGGSSGDDDEWAYVEVDHGTAEEVQLLRPTGSVVFGQVRESGQPLVDANVSLRKKRPVSGADPLQGMDLSALLGGAGGPNAASDGTGNYRIEQLEPGDYTLTVKHVTRALPAEFDLTVGSGEQRFDVDLTNAVVEGRVLDAAGQPVEGARVSATTVTEDGEAPPVVAFRMVSVTGNGGQAMTLGDGSDSVVTDSEGRYRLRGLPPERDLQVQVDPPIGSLFLTEGTGESFQLEPDEVRTGEDVELPTGGALRAQILDAAGNPAPFCMVLLRKDGEEDPERELAQSGQLERGGLEPGVWWVSTQALSPGTPQEPGEERRVVIAVGEVLELDLEL
ncbi:MAG: carboxypeptidase regulatory-like domain-containing protein [Planctomycetota bacterium]|jgi:protocatechuate 3,4-dioxygenase beta subunit